MTALEALAYSSAWVSLAAGLLVVAASRALGVETSAAATGLAFAGTLVVYNVDRLRDLPRDRTTSPRRTAWVEAHRDGLARLVLAAAVAAGLFALWAGARALLVLAPVAALGLLHRRLKRIPWTKGIYVTLAWVAVVVGLPVVLDPAARHVPWVAATLGFALLANAIASNVRDEEASAALLGTGRALALARGAAALGVATSLVAPASVRALLPVPLVTLAALALFRGGERYGLIAVDGALVAGAAAAIAAGI